MTSHVNLETVVDFFIAKVFRHGFVADVGDAGAAPDSFGIEFEFSEIGREKERATGMEPVQATVDEIGVVSLDVEIVAHPFGVGESRRIEDDEIKFFDGFVEQPGGDVGLDKPVLRAI